MNIYDVIKKPLITEKTTAEKDARNIIAFVVHRDANKIEIKESVEKLFKAEVIAVRTATVAGKVKRVGKQLGKRANWKKAYVTLKEGSNVDFFEV
ncbi:MAG: 50S ribosomal protein L23 [Geobacteraceae bacterium]|jgi:large subunit ribosomal protein L23